jgi:Tol biopolymer transport system component
VSTGPISSLRDDPPPPLGGWLSGWGVAAASGLARTLSAALSIGLCGLAAAQAVVVRERTLGVSLPTRGVADGSSGEPALSASGRVVAFASSASNLGPADGNGAVRDIYVAGVPARDVRLVSLPVEGAGANGPSSAPALSADGSVVAFASSASNLVFGDVNGVDDVFVREGPGAAVRVSIAPDGGPANGPSGQPSISGDGRYVAFTSAARNLVAGAGGPGTQVYVRDLVAQRTLRVSDAPGATPADGASSGPAMSADGRAVSFDSAATNLVAGDTNGVADVFVRALARPATERVSVSTSAAQQDEAVAAPFAQVSSISADGRYVVFDSDAGNLVGGDANRRTDVFLRDRARETTSLVSENNAGFQGNNDSFAPAIAADGGHVAFESFATNLSSGGGPRENVFVRDLGLELTSVVDVRSNGTRPGAEQVKQLLQRPALSANGRVAAFTSTARRLTGSSSASAAVFARRMTAPHGNVLRPPPRSTPLLRPLVTLAADDPQATRFACRIDDQPVFTCQRGTQRLPRQLPGKHVLAVRAGGPGLLYDPLAIKLPFTVRG